MILAYWPLLTYHSHGASSEGLGELFYEPSSHLRD